MSTPPIELDEYHKAIQQLEQEILAYGDGRRTINEVLSTLRSVQQLNANATTKLLQLSDETGTLLQDLRRLNLVEMQTTADERYTKHQAALTEMGKELERAVREQQRLGLETLQHTTASHGEMQRYSSAVEASAKAEAERQRAIDSRLEAIGTRLDAVSAKTTDLDAMARRAIWLSAVTPLLVGLIVIRLFM